MSQLKRRIPTTSDQNVDENGGKSGGKGLSDGGGVNGVDGSGGDGGDSFSRPILMLFLFLKGRSNFE